jgi:fibronectin-binding autotransporter adhesin
MYMRLKSDRRNFGSRGFDGLRRIIIILALGGGLADLPVFGQLTWDPTFSPATPAGGAGTWDATTANWSNGSTDVIWSANTAVFGGTGGAVTVSGTQNVTGLTINSTGYSLTGGTIDIGTGATFGVGGSFSGTLTIDSTIVGSGAITFSGPNTTAMVAMGGRSSYSGGTIITNSARVRVTQSSGLGTGAITFTGSSSNELLISSGVTLTQNIVASSQARVNVSSGTATLSGIISGTNASTSALIKNGAGTLIVSGANTYAGPTSLGSGTLQLGASNVLSAGTFNLNGGTFSVNGFDETVGALAFASGSIDFISGASNLAFAATSGLTWSGSANLNILNFTVGSDTLRFGSDSSGLTSTQLSRILFGSVGAQIDALGYVTPIPEPAEYTSMVGLLALGAVIYRRRRLR